jgi:hypothetical protein
LKANYAVRAIQCQPYLFCHVFQGNTTDNGRVSRLWKWVRFFIFLIFSYSRFSGSGQVTPAFGDQDLTEREQAYLFSTKGGEVGFTSGLVVNLYRDNSMSSFDSAQDDGGRLRMTVGDSG